MMDVKLCIMKLESGMMMMKRYDFIVTLAVYR